MNWLLLRKKKIQYYSTSTIYCMVYSQLDKLSSKTGHNRAQILILIDNGTLLCLICAIWLYETPPCVKDPRETELVFVTSSQR